MISKVLKESKKIVMKIGSNTLSNTDGTINHDFLAELADVVAKLSKQGKQVVIVSSGARIAGVSAIGKWKRKEDLHYKQALCAIGQVELIGTYRKYLGKFGINIGQMLFTREDFLDQNRTLNIRNTLFTLTDEGVVPIINENDTVTVEGIKIGDNDTLAAYVAKLWNADLLVLFSDIQGVFEKNPKEYPEAALIEEVRDIEGLLQGIEIGSTNSFGTGGISTKIEAARLVNEYDIPMILANGAHPSILEKLEAKEEKATLFLPSDY